MEVVQSDEHTSSSHPGDAYHGKMFYSTDTFSIFKSGESIKTNAAFKTLAFRGTNGGLYHKTFLRP